VGVCPEYRSRIFLSVDLVGSTGFKGGSGAEAGDSVHPVWIVEIGNFYQEFPTSLRRFFDRQAEAANLATSGLEAFPTTWKRVGDEIIFCCRVHSRDHLVCIVNAFIQALADYGKILEACGGHLDVKGTAWLAAFPSPNITVPMGDDDQNSPSIFPDEKVEGRADTTPHEFDFLGKSIDCGFRLGRFSSADKLVLSVELAFALCEAAESDGCHFIGIFDYDGRRELKGVLAGRPYPIVTIDTQRKAIRRKVLKQEMTLMGRSPVEAIHLQAFLQDFMSDEGIEPAIFLDGSQELQQHSFPRSYEDFRNRWHAHAAVMKRSEEGEKKAAEVPDARDDRDDVPPDVNAVLQEIGASGEGTSGEE